MIEPHKQKALTNLKKASTHIQKITQMIEDDRYCTDIMQQILAVQGYLQSSKNQVLTSHLQTCGVKNLSSQDQQQKDNFIDDIVRACGLAHK